VETFEIEILNKPAATPAVDSDKAILHMKDVEIWVLIREEIVAQFIFLSVGYICLI
jgi:hypothetical protein